MTYLKYHFGKYGKGQIGGLMLALLVILPMSSIFAQEEDQATEKVEKATARLNLSVTQIPGDTLELTALLRAKIGKTYEQIPDEEIDFFAVGAEENTSLGKSKTNEKGLANIKIHASRVVKNEEGYLNFAAEYAGNDRVKSADGDVSILKANIQMTPVEEDSLLTLKVELTAPTEEGNMPLAEADVVIFIDRLFSKLKVGEGTTDEDGVAEINFPLDLAGDDKGNLHITAYVEEYEEYGNLSAMTTKPWGSPVSYKIEKLPRALWSPDPPIWMVVTFFVLMGTVWGHYVVILLKLVKLRKEGARK